MHTTPIKPGYPTVQVRPLLFLSHPQITVQQAHHTRYKGKIGPCGPKIDLVDFGLINIVNIIDLVNCVEIWVFEIIFVIYNTNIIAYLHMSRTYG